MKGRTPPPRQLPADANDRRIAAALESGLVHDALDAFGMTQTLMAVAARVAAEGKNPADYVDFVATARRFAPIVARLEASGFNEALNKAWEARTGESLDDPNDILLAPLGTRKNRRRRP